MRMTKSKARVYTNVLATIEKTIQKTNLQFENEATEVMKGDDVFQDFLKIQQQLFAAADLCKTRLRPDSPKRAG